MLVRSLIDVVSCGAVLLVWQVGKLIVREVRKTRETKRLTEN